MSNNNLIILIVIRTQNGVYIVSNKSLVFKKQVCSNPYHSFVEAT